MESAISPYVLKKDGTSSGTRVLIDLTESELEDFAMSPVLDEDDDVEVMQTPPAVPVPSCMMLNHDVRYMIYKLLLKIESATVRPMHSERMSDIRRRISDFRRRISPRFPSVPEKTGISAAICRTSRIIAAESLPVLYGINTLEFIRSYSDFEDFAKIIGSNRPDCAISQSASESASTLS